MPDCAKTVYVDSFEVLEQKYPMRFGSYRLLPDTGGPGRTRGGPASEMVFGPTKAPMQAFFFADFAINPPEGVLGGGPGALAAASKIEADGSETELAPIGDVELVPGEWVRGLESGGGGYGDPLERDPALVLADVLEGWVSVAGAEADYGVVFSGAIEDESLAVDVEQTNERRKGLEGPPERRQQ
jgi:N-methylhydantoinase B